jgi:TRAP-type C4-dicarboxylate transport system substrate-binding protein
MLNRRLSVLVGVICFVLVTVLLLMGVYVAPAPAEEIELSLVGFLPATHADVRGMMENFVNPLNERAKGTLAIKWRGGPESFAANDIGPAVQKGIVDIGFIYVGAYEPIVPGVGALMLSQYEPEEERSGGFYDYFLELHKKYGLYYLMRPAMTSGNFFYTWLKTPVEKPKDLEGMLIGSATAGQPAVLSWKGAWVSVAVADCYTALERGVVKGIAGQPVATWVNQAGYEVAKYNIDHPYYKCTVALIMNLNKWNKLPKNVQDMLKEATIKAETKIKAWQDKLKAKQRQLLTDKGVKFIKFSPEDAAWYVKSAYDSAWEVQQKRFPDVTPKLRELLTKK